MIIFEIPLFSLSLPFYFLNSISLCVLWKKKRNYMISILTSPVMSIKFSSTIYLSLSLPPKSDLIFSSLTITKLQQIEKSYCMTYL